MTPIDIVITYDFICPWCWIGHQSLKASLGQAGMADRARFSYRPYELNPDMPIPSVDRKEYRSRKFGSWARSQALDADVAAAGKRVGLTFNYDRVQITPNTRLAHRLMRYAQDQQDAARADRLFDAVMQAYFAQGQDIGSIEVLVDIAAWQGYDAARVREYLSGTAGEAEVVAQELQAQLDGIHSVPSFVIGRHRVSGGQPPEYFTRVLQAEAANAGSA
ncbi:DsbA family oxidoreductase [Cupriavidus sp. IDO]|uniref:DsbA family oxidoreductase n=1 Tax=Cupriavidus sp. IDO TaxID=1539142 RepID=UPI000578EC17|nr:DsbA family oxidoreductase [Cupriavidus sp. IDO]KWR89893.1 disulfide bond formation protein DsbA [Cupriavidus sp. IDO]